MPAGMSHGAAATKAIVLAVFATCGMYMKGTGSMHFLRTAAFAAVALSTLAIPAAASPLTSGGLVFPAWTTAAANPDLAGVVVNE